jgi:hypothetical protein
MAPTSTGLSNGGQTAHYQFTYDDSLGGTGGIEPARTNQVLANCEADFTLMSGWFNNVALDVSFRIPVNVTQNGGGASWSLSGGNLTVTINPANGNQGFVRYLLVAEMTEQFMRAQGRGWYGTNTEGSQGEGLSRFLSAQFLVANGLGAVPAGFLNSNSWLNSSRQDFVNNINYTDDGPDAVTGCSLLFIYYLFSQLGFTINQIVAAGANTLGGVYRNLTGDTADPFPFFKQLCDTAFPGTSTITTGNLDDPFPLGILSFWVDKSTFGSDEVTDVIASSSHGGFDNAFWLVLEGFNIQNFTALGIGAPALSGAFSTFTGVNITSNAASPEFENPTTTGIPQRIRFPYDVTFQSGALTAFPGPGQPPVFEELDGAASVAGTPLRGASAVTEFELVGGADPYFTNIDAAQDNVFYLSQDLRVFTATPAINPTPVTGGPAFTDDSFVGAYSWIQAVLGFLNDPANHFVDGAVDPFATGVVPQPGDALTGDSSVTPFTLRSIFPLEIDRNYNFALARVRLRGTAGPAGRADNVKVFFRMWSTQSADTDFQPQSTYLSQQVGGRPEFPLPAPDSHTFPFFATSNSPDLANSANPEYGTNGINNRSIQIASGDKEFAFFGCFLNVYDASNTVNGSPVQTVLAGTHHCLVAELAYDGAPIVNAGGTTASPENSDKLAQRNLQVTHSDNPGPGDTHRIPQTFDIRPSGQVQGTPGDLLDHPDELMIDWGTTPVGSVAHIFWPRVDAVTVLQLAHRLYGTHLLSASDNHTVDCTVDRGVTYVPIPPGTGENFAGLLTIDLPTTVVAGQTFDIVVRRVATRTPPPIIEIGLRERRGIEGGVEAAGASGASPEDGSVAGEDATYGASAGGRAPTAPPGEQGGVTGPVSSADLKAWESAGRDEQTPAMRNWRYVVGTFQIKIPVSRGDTLLRDEETALAIMKWRLGQMSATNRWRPVLERYVGYLSARVDGLGGDSTSIEPSPDGAPVRDGKGRDRCVTGRVCEVVFDCFGDFEGFVLRDCSERWAFRSREPAVRDLVLEACRLRLQLTVYGEKGADPEIRRIVVTCC